MTDRELSPGHEAAGLGLRRAEPSTAGARLKALREASGMHIGVLSATLKVPQARLEALEADRLGELPDATFARALAKAVCRVLKVDPSEVLALLPASTEPGLERVSKGLNQTFKAQALGGGGVSLAVLRKPVVLAPVGVLLAAAVVYFLPADFAARWKASDVGTGPVAASEPAFDPAADARVGAVSTTAPTPLSTTAPAPAASAPAEASAGPAVLAPASTPSAPSMPGASVAASAATVPAPAVASAPAPVSPPAAAATLPSGGTAGLAPLRLRASADTWVEVADARGQVQYSRLMRAGDVADLQVQTPVKVRVGNVSGTSLSLRGEPVDLLARSRDNVARLELP
ncbi:helix-turn-helix domain-containing protein [Pelomonas sp. APW6]|uniref:Helix-turn-helix domain-containing protein n=1 Tax=Roseateles subflavus TaxID=3053353 RepID=A0ABT7LH96_9BURK|nr:helix-turn-helix domain-containing protein [Pelomonas sp. APW6]MDL5032219.1 helix-turn-helix domain-containing protein [Pelomonas sp. APW6]